MVVAVPTRTPMLRFSDWVHHFSINLRHAYLMYSHFFCPSPMEKVSICPVNKTLAKIHSNFRPISITCVPTRIIERTVVGDYINPTLLDPPLLFTHQFAFHPSTWFNYSCSHHYSTHHHQPPHQQPACHCHCPRLQ